MPSTRALSTRSHLPSDSISQTQSHHPIKPVKSSNSNSSSSSSSLKSKSSTSSAYTSPSLKRTQSSPSTPVSTRARTKAAQSTPSSSRSNSSSSNTHSPSKPRNSRRSTSSKLLLKSEETTTPSDNEDEEDEGRERRNRVGGCSSQSEALEERDDSNKENIAPFLDSITATELQREREEDVVARRTRGAQQRQEESTTLPSTPRPIRRSLSSSSVSSPSEGIISSPTSTSIASRVRANAPSSSGRNNLFNATPEQRRGRGRPSIAQSRSSSSAGTVRSPSSSNNDGDSSSLQQEGSQRKRSRRGAPSSLITSTPSPSQAGPSSPLARLQLDSSHGNLTLNGNNGDDVEGYFSSQTSTIAGSLFDSASQEDASSIYALGTTVSRASSPGTDVTEGEGSQNKVEDSTVDTVMSESIEEEEEEEEETKQVESPSLFKRFTNVYAHARSLLRYATGVTSTSTTSEEEEEETEVSVVGRETERLHVETFLHKKFSIFPHIEQSSQSSMDLDEDEDDLDLVSSPNSVGAGCLYVCGLPGTGKTALIRSIISGIKKTDATGESDLPIPRSVFVNCMTVSHPRLIWAAILYALGEGPIKNAKDGQIDIEAEKRVNELVKKSKDNNGLLIVLDEIDHLLHSRAHQNVLYRLFALSSPSSSCGLIGIANSLDLTERFVPLLQSKGASPELLHFRPFDAQEIITVVKSRLEGLFECYDGTDEEVDHSNSTIQISSSAKPISNQLPLFSSPALELAAKKIAAVTGDLRKALDACRLAVELVELEQRTKASDAISIPQNSSQETQQKVSTNDNLDSSKLLSHMTPSSAPKVMPTHVLKVLGQVLGSPQLTKVRNLPLHPKLILLSFLVCKRRAEENMSVLGSEGGNNLVGSSSIKSNTGLNSAAANGKIRIADLISTYGYILKEEGSFASLEHSELIAVIDLLEVQGLFSIDSDCLQSTSATGHLNSSSVNVTSNGVSPGGKRATKKQLLASNRNASLVISVENVLKGITTTPPASAEVASTSTSALIPNLMNRIWIKEENRIQRSRNWESENRDREKVRREELGGGRGALF